MPVPAVLVLGVTGCIHGCVLLMFTDIGYFLYKAYNDHNNKLMENMVYDIIFMIIGYLLTIWLITILIRAEKTLRRIHDTLSCV